MKRILSSLFAIVLSIGMCLPQASLAYAADSAFPSSGSTVSDISRVSQSPSSSSSASSDSSNNANVSSSVPVASSSSATVTSASSSSSVSVTQQEDKALKIASISAASNVDESQEGVAYKKGEVLVVFKDSAQSESSKQTLADAVTVKEGQAEEKSVVAENTVVAQVADGATVAQAVTELSQNRDVAIVQPNYCYTVLDDASNSDISASSAVSVQSTTVNDPYTKSDSSYYQWQLSKYVSGSTTTADLGINAFGAWDYAKCNGSVGVAVIDTGCLVTHEDLAANIIGAYNAYNADHGGSISDVTDDLGHGTHVCGIIGAVSNNGKGGSGVSYNAKVMPVKACDDNNQHNFYTAELVKSYQYVIANATKYNIRVINMSLGGVSSTTYEDASSWSDDALCQQIDAAYNAGILTVCAAGNYNSVMPYVAYPSDYSTCISVINLCQGLDTATMTNAAERDSESNYNFSGHQVKNISAPGSGIWSTSNTGGYVSMSGTSMASPVVAGVAALVFAANGSLSPEDCKSILYGTARDCEYTSFGQVAGSGWDVYTGYGEVNAEAAVVEALNIAPSFGDVACTLDASSLEVSLPVSRNPSSVANAAFAVTAAGATRWYQAVASPDGSAWTARVPLSDFRAYGAYAVAAWATSGGSTSAVGSASPVVPAPTGSVTAAAGPEGTSVEAGVSISSSTGIGNAAFQVVAPNGTTKWVTAALSGTVGTATVSASDLGGALGRYSVTAWLCDGMGAVTSLGSASCVL